MPMDAGEQLIGLVRDRPCSYDVSHKDYFNPQIYFAKELESSRHQPRQLL